MIDFDNGLERGDTADRQTAHPGLSVGVAADRGGDPNRAVSNPQDRMPHFG